MKRLIIGLLAVAALTCSSAALAEGTKTVSGQLSGESEWQPPFIRTTAWTIHGTYTSDALGSGTYSGALATNHDVVDASVEAPAGCFAAFLVPCQSPRFAVTGSVTFTSDKGASITGTVAPGSWVVEADAFPSTGYTFDLTLELSGGTRRFKHLTGSLSLSYQSQDQIGIGCGFDCGKNLDFGTLTGSIGH
ncbi:MAG: hypothetical protein E6G22_01275 [Actinobacteria bacterium]|nr:MAG: hypothetical protein E6G22_01275 [Actinomycetota bacterium]